MKYFGLLLVLLISSTFSCKQTSEADQVKDGNTAQIEPQEDLKTGLPSIPEELLKQIFLECDFVDYIFYELPFSMSYDKQGTIQSSLRWVDQSTDIPTSGCKALGRMIFQKKGEIMIEAELYVSENCSYYKWILDGKPEYDNLMSESGFIHYMSIIKQFEKK